MTFFKRVYENIPKAGVVNVYGKQGCGKTTFFSRIKHVELDYDVLKTKEKTIDFFSVMRCSLLPIVLDDFESNENLPGIKEIKHLKKTPVYIVSCSKISLACVTDHFQFPDISVEEFAESSRLDVQTVKNSISKNRGNLNNVVTDLTVFKSDRDRFLSSTEYVVEIFREDENFTKYIDRHLNEHGNTFGLVHENYINHVFDMKDVARITQSFSDSELIERIIYSDIQWNLMPFFNVSACLIPSSYVHCEEPEPKSLRPGSMWTEYLNMCMKNKRLKTLRINREYIHLWALKANAGEKIPFDSYNLDSINQLSFAKIKPKILTSLKKCLKSKS